VIARVRIAPVERWCEGSRNGIHIDDGLPLITLYPAGFEVRILTETCRTNFNTHCKGLAWRVEANSVNEIRALTGRPPINYVTTFCEHMLEMD
jgi:hypothetical protein